MDLNSVRNRVFEKSLPLGKNNPISLKTTSDSIYRLTGMNQINDIINSGVVRPKEGKVAGGHVGEVFWSHGGENLYYYGKSPVLEVGTDKLYDNMMGCVSINDLKGVWIFNEEERKYENKIIELLEAYEFNNNENLNQESMTSR